jgi:hypothetical protein
LNARVANASLGARGETSVVLNHLEVTSTSVAEVAHVLWVEGSLHRCQARVVIGLAWKVHNWKLCGFAVLYFILFNN